MRRLRNKYFSYPEQGHTTNHILLNEFLVPTIALSIYTIVDTMKSQ